MGGGIEKSKKTKSNPGGRSQRGKGASSRSRLKKARTEEEAGTDQKGCILALGHHFGGA